MLKEALEKVANREIEPFSKSDFGWSVPKICHASITRTGALEENLWVKCAADF